MTRIAGWSALRLLPLALVACGSAPVSVPPTGPGDAVRGEYVFNAAGCLGCHTAKGGERLAGGRGLPTPFGTFYTPNITPDPEHGIGRWAEEDFFRAMRHGRAPNGWAYFPSFPYTSFTRMTDTDLHDLWAYLGTRKPVAQPDREHDLRPPFGWRFTLPVWQALFFESGELPPEPGRPPEWQRGRYLARALGHCGECHTPRNALGVTDDSRLLAGSKDGPEGKPIPNLTPHRDGIGTWSDGDVLSVLELGILPDGDFVGRGMDEVVENTTSKLTADDRRAILAYLRSLSPVPDEQ